VNEYTADHALTHCDIPSSQFLFSSPEKKRVGGTDFSRLFLKWFTSAGTIGLIMWSSHIVGQVDTCITIRVIIIRQWYCDSCCIIIDPIDVFGLWPRWFICHSILVVLNYCLPTHFGPDSAIYIPLFDCLSLEYNHAIPPALSSLLAYFGGGSYIVKTGYARVIKLSIHSVYVYYYVHAKVFSPHSLIIWWCSITFYLDSTMYIIEAGDYHLLTWSWSIRWDACCHGNTIHVSRTWMVTGYRTGYW